MLHTLVSKGCGCAAVRVPCPLQWLCAPIVGGSVLVDWFNGWNNGLVVQDLSASLQWTAVTP